MVCCLFICLCIFMILLAGFDSNFWFSAARKRALKCLALLSVVQNTYILFFLFFCTPIIYFFFLEQLHVSFIIRLSTVLVPVWQQFGTQLCSPSTYRGVLTLSCFWLNWQLKQQQQLQGWWGFAPPGPALMQLTPFLPAQGTLARSSWKQTWFPFHLAPPSALLPWG